MVARAVEHPDWFLHFWHCGAICEQDAAWREMVHSEADQWMPGRYRVVLSQSCQLSQAAQARLRNPLGYLHCKSVAPLPHCFCF